MRHLLTLLFSLLSIHVIAQTPLEPYDGVWYNFEDNSNYNYILINPADSLNTWNIGWTEKFTGDSISVLFTDSTASYAANLHSWFQVKLNDHTYGGPTFIQFNLSGSTQLGDGMYIEVSYDDGASFENIIYDSIPGQWNGSYTEYASDNLYSQDDTLFSGEPGFTGEINEQIYIQWQDPCVGQPRSFLSSDSMIVRFNFISDSIDSNHPGYAIDDYNMEIVLCFSLEELANNQFELIQNPISDFIQLRMIESISNYAYELFSLDGKQIQSKTDLYESSFRIEAGHLSVGNYFLIIRDEEGNLISRHKVIKH